MTAINSGLVRAMRLAMEYSGDRKIFNVSSCRGVSVSELLEILLRVTGAHPEILREPERSFDVPKNILDNAVIRETLNWTPEVDLEEGIRCTWEWVKKQV